jgi:hypothetical protein
LRSDIELARKERPNDQERMQKKKSRFPEQRAEESEKLGKVEGSNLKNGSALHCQM